MNTGQSPILNRLDRELEISSITLTKESDWYNKLGVQITSDMFWEDVLDTIALKWKNVRILASQDALKRLINTNSTLLPIGEYELFPQEDYSYVGLGFILKIDMIDYSPMRRNAILELSGGLTQNEDYVPDLITFRLLIGKEYHGSNIWSVNQESPIYIYGLDKIPIGEAPNYKYFVSSLSSGSVKLEFNDFEAVLQVNFPIANPLVSRSPTATSPFQLRPIRLKSKAVFFNHYVMTFDFNGIRSGKSLGDGSDLLLKYSGKLYLILETDPEKGKLAFRVMDTMLSPPNNPLVGEKPNVLFIEILRKSTGGLFYERSYREIEIGSDSGVCRIEKISILK